MSQNRIPILADAAAAANNVDDTAVQPTAVPAGAQAQPTAQVVQEPVAQEPVPIFATATTQEPTLQLLHEQEQQSQNQLTTTSTTISEHFVQPIQAEQPQNNFQTDHNINSQEVTAQYPEHTTAPTPQLQFPNDELQVPNEYKHQQEEQEQQKPATVLLPAQHEAINKDDPNNKESDVNEKEQVSTEDNTNNDKKRPAAASNLDKSDGAKVVKQRKKKRKFVMLKPRTFLPFNDMLFKLMQFRMEQKNCLVPHDHDLYPWVLHLRRQYPKFEKLKTEQTTRPPEPNELTSERVAVLSSIGFVWNVVRDESDKRWNAAFEKLLEYKKIHGDCNVPQKNPDNLGKWVQVQRFNKVIADKKKRGENISNTKSVPLSQDRIEKLESIGFEWRLKKPAIGWEARFEQLVRYKEENGDCNVSQTYEPDRPFGRWVMKQRHEHSLKLRGLKSQLTDEREARLNGIGFRWVAPGFKKRSVEYNTNNVNAHVNSEINNNHNNESNNINGSSNNNFNYSNNNNDNMNGGNDVPYHVAGI